MECFCSLLQVSKWPIYFKLEANISKGHFVKQGKGVLHTHTHTRTCTPPNVKVIEMENDTMR